MPRFLSAALLLLAFDTASAHETCRLDFDSGASVTLPLARSRAEQVQGLAGKADPGAGIIMVWDHVAVRTVWMKDTPAPLTAVFIGPDGLVQSVQDMEPNSLTYHSSLRPLISIVEVPTGSLAATIKRGSVLTASTCFSINTK
ncbi:DUF192 domain-containing protein [Pseudomonas caspiana]|nr:DUF192 domain-containing protein [Pseudomonas caspiana]TPG86721.1 DUF192 domain-containing protein [Pseudomonas caspiana]